MHLVLRSQFKTLEYGV